MANNYLEFPGLASKSSCFPPADVGRTLVVLKIALLILHADPSRGGAERYTVDLAAGLRGRGHTVALVASTIAASVRQAGDVRLDTGSHTRLGRYLRFLDQLDRHLIANRYDIVHAMLPARTCHLYHPHAGIAAESIMGGHLKYEGPIMQVISRVASRLNRRRQRFAAVERSLLGGEHPPIVVCLSDYVKRIVRAHYPLDDRHVATLFNAIDLDRFDPSLRPESSITIRNRYGIESGQIVALMIAQDFARKGLREAIVATAAVKDPRLVLLVVGKPDTAPYRRLAEQLGIKSRVIFAGETNDPYAFYRAADFFVLPTRHDPCSLVVLESLAMGVPVISTALNGACEIMTDGAHGFVLQDPSDVISLAEAMRSMLDENKRLTLATACAELRPRLAFGKHLDALERIYDAARAMDLTRGST